MSSESNKEYSVNWKNHMSHVRKAFDHLLSSNELTDVTLCCEGKKIGAHKMLLSACSAYFRDTFKDVPCQHPVIILYGVEYGVLSDILHFIYNGEVSVDTSKLDSFLKTAQLLQISGLTDDSNDRVNSENEQNTETPASEDHGVEETYTEPISFSAPVNEETKKGVKRLRIKEIETTREKLQRQENDTLFISDVKCEPSELVNFEDPLEDPLLQSDQSNDTREFYSTSAGQNTVEEEFKTIFVEDQSFKRFGERSDDLTETIDKLIPINTKRTRRCIQSAFEKFCEERGYVLNGGTPIEEISSIMSDWGFNMRRADGTDYKESVIKTIWNTTAKLLQDVYYEKYKVKFDPFRDIIFKKARDARDAKRRLLKSCPEKRKMSSAVLSEMDRHKIYAIWDENTPCGLQRKFYHIAAFQLGWKGREAANCLVHFFQDEFNTSGLFTGRIAYNPSLFGNTTQEVGPNSSETKWLVVNSVNPSVCPVRLLRLLLSKRKSIVNITTDRLFLTPNPFWSKSESSAWYKDCPVGANQISTWTKEAAEKIGIDTKKIKITNRSICSSTSTSFDPRNLV